MAQRRPYADPLGMAEIPSPPVLRPRGPSWRHPAYGIAVRIDLDGRASLLAELAEWQRHLPPSAVFTGVTAAAVHGLWLPGPIDALPHFVAMGTVKGEVKPIRRRLRISRHPSVPARTIVDGLRLAPVPDALLACARILNPLDLVILIDSALHLELCTRGAIEAAAGPRRKGAPALRATLALADSRSESAWESVMRMLHHVLGVAVTPQVDLYGADGVFVGRADLLLDGTRTLHEYDGGGHRDRAQHRKDLKRDRDLVNTGYTRRGYTSDVLLRNASSVLVDCERALDRSLPRSALIEWQKLLSRSLVTPAGRHEIRRRLGT